MLEGKTANANQSINQSISQLVVRKEKDAIYSVFGSHW